MAQIEGIRAAARPVRPSTQPTALLNAEQTRALTEKIKHATALAPAEQQAMAALTPEQRKQYAAVASKVGGAEREQLQALLVAAKLNGGRDLQLRGDLLANLAKLATEPLGPGLDRKDLMAQAVRALADPASITQGGAETCGAATTQALLARQNPAEYVRILAGLASAEGKVRLINGTTLTRNAGWDKADIPGSAGQLMQTAFMTYAAGSYDAATDTRADGQKGLYASEQGFLQEAVLGKAVETVHGNGADVMARIAAQANAGKAVSVLIECEGRGHYVQVKSVRDGKLTYVDPRDGREHTVDATGFQGMVKAANLESEAKRPLRKHRPTDQKGILGGCGLIKAIVNAVKSVVKAVVNVVKAVVKTVVNVAKSVAQAAFKAIKAIGNVIASVAKVLWNGIKAVGKFIAKNLAVILTIAQIVCMFVPGLQVVALAIAAYNAVKSGIALYNGIKNGDWKAALMGGIGMVASFAGGVGALGAKVVGQGLATAASIAGKVANVAGNVMNAAEAIKNKNWGGLISSVASGVAAGAGVVSEKAGAIADKWAGYAHKLNGVYQAAVNKNVGAALGSAVSLAAGVGKGELGMADKTAGALGKIGNLAAAAGNVQGAVQNGNALGIAGAALGLAQAGVAPAAGQTLTPEQEKKTGAIQKILDAGKQALTFGGKVVDATRKYGTAAALGVLGGAAVAGGIRYLTMSPEEREQARNAMSQAGNDWGTGKFDRATKTGAGLIGLDPAGGFAGFLGKLGEVAGNGLNLAEGLSRAKNIADVATRTGYFDLEAARKNQDRMRGGLEGLGKVFHIDKIA